MAQRARKHGAKPGDMIEISHGTHKKWALYIDNDEVIYLTCDGNGRSDTGRVELKTIWEVVQNEDFKVNNLLDDGYNRRKRSTITREARDRVGQELPYSPAGSNCEHFASNLRYGKAESRQVRGGTLGAGASGRPSLTCCFCYCCGLKSSR